MFTREQRLHYSLILINMLFLVDFCPELVFAKGASLCYNIVRIYPHYINTAILDFKRRKAFHYL